MTQQFLTNRYRLIRLLGTGNQGEVYLALDRRLDREVAVKLLKPSTSAGQSSDDDVRSFRREAMITARFEHPHVVAIYDYDVTPEGLPFLVMEYLRGEPLDSLQPPLHDRELRRFVSHVGAALQSAHERGLLHRDLKPGNIFLVDRGLREERFVLLDLGIAKLADVAIQSRTLESMTFAGAGTPLYMSPEQVDGQSGDARSDVYSFGSTLFELLTGSAPFAGQADSLLGVLHAVKSAPPPRLSDVGGKDFAEPLEQLLSECLAKNADGRPATIREVVDRFLVATATELPVATDSAFLGDTRANRREAQPADPLQTTGTSRWADETRPKVQGTLQAEGAAQPSVPVEQQGRHGWQDRTRPFGPRRVAIVLCSLVALAVILYAFNRGSRFVLEPIPKLSIDEGVPWSFAPRWQTRPKAEWPVKFKLRDAPPTGMSISPVDGLLQWTPGESQGHGEYPLVVQAVDPENEHRVLCERDFILTVREVNAAPDLTDILEQTIDELEPINLTFSASDVDQPPNQLDFRLAAGAPQGAQIDAKTGEFSWTPSERDGPGRHRVRVIVRDDGSPPMERSTEFHVTVEEVNRPPWLHAIADREVEAGQELILSITAQDVDKPVNELRYEVVGPAARGAAIEHESGQFRWTPPLALAGDTHSFTIRVTDGYKPPGTAEMTVRVQVTLPRTLRNPLGMELRLIPAGAFEMGSTPEEIERVRDFDSSFARQYGDAEQPRHRVEITQPFYLGVHEVTKGEFAEFVRDTGHRTDAEKDGEGGWGWSEDTETLDQKPEFTWKNSGFAQTDRHPVVNVSWNDAQAFCDWLSRQESCEYQLPTEAQWEYAARAGSTTLYPWGDEPASLEGRANVADQRMRELPNQMDDSAWLPFDDRFAFTSPVGSFDANGWGLYDMTGNVWEWCADVYDASYYARSPLRDPPGPKAERGSNQVHRGGSWEYSAGYCRSAFRERSVPGYQDYGLGFRVTVVPPSK